MSTNRLRAPFRYYGGKGAMMTKLLPLIPERRVYCEPFCGAASIFFSREPSPVEVLNDLDGEIINFFRVMQSRVGFEELRHRLMWTPYSRAEFKRALEGPHETPEDRAWALFVRLNQGFGGIAKTVGNWGRSFISAGGISKQTNQWLMRLSMLDAWRWRLMSTVLDNQDAIKVIRYWDSTDTVFYLDPPYVSNTRVAANASNVYTHEADDTLHRNLVSTLLTIKGAAVLSGYHNPIYKPLEDAGWIRHDFKTACHAAGRTRGSGLQGKGAALAKVPRVDSAWVWDPQPPASTTLLPSAEPDDPDPFTLPLFAFDETPFQVVSNENTFQLALD